MFCPECGTNNGDSAKFCSACGGKMPDHIVAEPPVSQTVAPDTITPAPSEADFQTPPMPTGQVTPSVRPPRQPITLTPQQKKAYIFGGSGAATLVLILVILFSIPGLMTPLKAGQIPSYSKAFTATQKEEQAKPLCQPLAEALPTSTEKTTLNNQIKALNTAKGFSNRQARNFVDGADWAVASNKSASLETEINGIVDPALEEVAAKSGIMGINASNAKVAADSWRTEFRDSALEACGLTAAYTAASAAATNFDTAMSDVQTLADSAPWYPEGYSEYEGTFAYRWVPDAGDDCWGCRYSTMDVVTATPCSNGVYVEVNFLDGDTVIDWSNDTLSSLSTGQVGRLQFESYKSNANQTQVSTMTCNQ